MNIFGYTMGDQPAPSGRELLASKLSKLGVTQDQMERLEKKSPEAFQALVRDSSAAAQRAKDLAAREAQVTSRETAASSRHAELEKREAVLSAAQSANAEKEQHLVAQGKQLAQFQESLTAQQAAAGRKEGELAEWEKGIKNAQSELEAEIAKRIAAPLQAATTAAKAVTDRAEQDAKETREKAAQAMTESTTILGKTQADHDAAVEQGRQQGLKEAADAKTKADEEAKKTLAAATAEAKKLRDDALKHQRDWEAFTKKRIPEVQARESAVKVREDAVKQKEVELTQKDEALRTVQAALVEKVRKLVSAAPTLRQLSSYAEFVEAIPQELGITLQQPEQETQSSGDTSAQEATAQKPASG